jgi:hypothetical protein
VIDKDKGESPCNFSSLPTQVEKGDIAFSTSFNLGVISILRSVTMGSYMVQAFVLKYHLIWNNSRQSCKNTLESLFFWCNSFWTFLIHKKHRLSQNTLLEEKRHPLGKWFVSLNHGNCVTQVLRARFEIRGLPTCNPQKPSLTYGGLMDFQVDRSFLISVTFCPGGVAWEGDIGSKIWED